VIGVLDGGTMFCKIWLTSKCGMNIMTKAVTVQAELRCNTNIIEIGASNRFHIVNYIEVAMETRQ
jgi:hypothetical protein